MSRTTTYQAIVLKTYDVGEADRFCILLTRERGRIAARAKAVRKLTSKMGGSLLAGNQINVDVHDGKSGFLITAVHAHRDTADTSHGIAHFLEVQQATELLLHILHDDEPVTELYDAFTLFLTSSEQSNILLAFHLHALHLMGLLPSPTEGKLGAAVTQEECAFLEQCMTDHWSDALPLPSSAAQRLQRLCDRIHEQQTSSALRAGEVMRNLTPNPSPAMPN